MYNNDAKLINVDFTVPYSSVSFFCEPVLPDVENWTPKVMI